MDRTPHVGAEDGFAEIVRCIVQAVDPVQVILFGSAARGEAHLRSDLDLLVVLPPETKDKREAATAARRSVKDLPYFTDIVVATTADLRRRGHLVGTVLRPALQEGEVIYERA